ncbi:hypothetical protein OROMI_020826 [Orobanche minor]
MEAVKVRKFLRVFNDLFAEPLTPPGDSWPRNDEEQVSLNECSPGLLDMYSFDTNLLPEYVSPCMMALKLIIFSDGRSFACQKSLLTSYILIFHNMTSRPKQLNLKVLRSAKELYNIRSSQEEEQEH